jgi:uncharacterized membrane protein YfcA
MDVFSGYDPWLLLLILAAAVLYSSVGHGGASGYLAVMGLYGIAPAFMKPAALTMNIAVSGLVWWRLYRSGVFNQRLFLPFALASVPLALLGGALKVHDSTYFLIVGVALCIAALRMFLHPQDAPATGTPAVGASLAIGGVLGFLSGLTGVGGGIFLSPVLLFLRWTSMRENAAIAAAFIFVNSVAGLTGHVLSGAGFPDGTPPLVAAAFLGGILGSEFAVRRLPPTMLKRLLGVVLFIAGAKLLVRGWPAL